MLNLKKIVICFSILFLIIFLVIIIQCVIVYTTNKANSLYSTREKLGDLIGISLDSDDITIKNEKIEQGEINNYDYTRIYILMEVPNKIIEESECYNFSHKSLEDFSSREKNIEYLEINGINQQNLRYINVVYSEYIFDTFMGKQARPFNTMVYVTDIVFDERTVVLLSTSIPYKIRYSAD